MKKYLDKKYGDQPTNDNPETPFRIVFFRHYDKGIVNGNFTFSQLEMDKDMFICLSTAQEVVMKKSEVIQLCVNMKLTEEEAETLMESAGYEVV